MFYVFFIFLLLYTMTKESTMSLIGLSLWGSLIAFVLKERFNLGRKEWVFLITMFFILLFHYYFTNDTIISSVMYMVVLLFIFQIQNKTININILYVPIVILIIQPIFNFSDFIISLGAKSDIYAFKGFYQNSNTCSIFISITYLCVLFLIKKRTIKHLLVLFVLLNLYACMSRNAILFIFMFHLFFYLLKRKYNKLSLVITLLFLIFSGYYMLFFQSDSALKLFGKEGTTGRSLQIIYIYEKYSLTCFGIGRDLLSHQISDIFRYPPHNMFFYTCYGMGVFYFFLYSCFIYFFYNRLNSNISKSALIALQIYYFYEPVIPFEISLSFLMPMIVLLIIDSSFSLRYANVCKE